MAAATITNTSWGYNAKTGTDATDVVTTKVYLLSIKTMGTAGSETVLVKDGKGNVLQKIVAVANKTESHDYFGAPVDGLNVTLSASTVEANFFIK